MRPQWLESNLLNWTKLQLPKTLKKNLKTLENSSGVEKAISANQQLVSANLVYMDNIKPKDIKHNWHLIDAKNQIVGRLSSEIAHKLMGKNKPTYTPYLLSGDTIVVINAKAVSFSGKKENQKNYYHHSGYPGGLKTRTAAQIRKQKPLELIRHSVRGMLPKNKLGKQMLRNLFIFEGMDHPYKDKFKN